MTVTAVEGGAVAAAGRVRTPSGRTISQATARRVHAATPANTDRSRTSRTGAYAAWCAEHGRVGTDPGTLPDWAAHLADRGYRAETIETYAGAVAATLAVSGAPVDEEDRSYLRAVVNSRAAEEAADRSGAGDALQATECTRADLAAMIATRDTGTLAGLRDAFALSLDWYMAGRASEPCALHIEDVREVTAELVDDDETPYTWPALEITVRRSKTNPHGLKRDVVRVLAQDDATCPVALFRAWTQALAASGITSGPLLRRVKNDKLTTAGRPPADPKRAGGWGDRSLRNLIAECARLAGLAGEDLTEDERELLSTTAERRALAQLPDDQDLRDAHRAEMRRHRRALRARRPRYTGHSMRRGCVRHQQRQGTGRHIIEQHCRYQPGSRALSRYLDAAVPWADNPTRPRRTPHRAPDGAHVAPGWRGLRP